MNLPSVTKCLTCASDGAAENVEGNIDENEI